MAGQLSFTLDQGMAVSAGHQEDGAVLPAGMSLVNGQSVRMLHAASPVPMVVLVPSRLQEMRLLRGTAQVISGRDSLLRLRDMLRQALKGSAGPESSGELTDLRKRTLISLCTAITRNASLKAASRKDYYLRACLVEYAGVENLHVLCTSGLLPGVITDETGQRF